MRKSPQLDDIDQLAMQGSGAAMFALEGLHSRAGTRVASIAAGRRAALRAQASNQLAEHTASGLPLQPAAGVPDALRTRLVAALDRGRVRRRADSPGGSGGDHVALVEVIVDGNPMWVVTSTTAAGGERGHAYPAEADAITRYELLDARLRAGQPLHDEQATD